MEIKTIHHVQIYSESVNISSQGSSVTEHDQNIKRNYVQWKKNSQNRETWREQENEIYEFKQSESIFVSTRNTV